MQIYFIQQGSSDLIKIGCSKNVARRFRELQTGSPHTFLLLGVMEGDRDKEKEIHTKFTHLRQKGEWFKLNHDLSSFISKNCEFDDLPILPQRRRKF